MPINTYFGARYDPRSVHSLTRLQERKYSTAMMAICNATGSSQARLNHKSLPKSLSHAFCANLMTFDGTNTITRRAIVQAKDPRAIIRVIFTSQDCDAVFFLLECSMGKTLAFQKDRIERYQRYIDAGDEAQITTNIPSTRVRSPLAMETVPAIMSEYRTDR